MKLQKHKEERQVEKRRENLERNFHESISRVWTKNTIVWGIFDANSMEKLHFYPFLGKFVGKYRNIGNNITFLQHFSAWVGGVNPPPQPPAYATEDMYCF